MDIRKGRREKRNIEIGKTEKKAELRRTKIMVMRSLSLNRTWLEGSTMKNKVWGVVVIPVELERTLPWIKGLKMWLVEYPLGEIRKELRLWFNQWGKKSYKS
uniref:Uncharacterized protein n=1 Tax=Brassica oleracea TaxID=3712 RepID=A0A3P6FXS8_BRAOL|nr:unnamed protein product [Brassica oleracea]